MQMLGYQTKRITHVGIWLEGMYQMAFTAEQKEFKTVTGEYLDELVKQLNLSDKQDLVGMEILEKIEGSTTKRAYIPKGATLTIAARSKEGELLDLKFE